MAAELCPVVMLSPENMAGVCYPYTLGMFIYLHYKVEIERKKNYMVLFAKSKSLLE